MRYAGINEVREDEEVHASSPLTLFGNAVALKAVYTRMNEDIVRVVCAIPKGRVTTVDAISEFLLVSPHHVSFLATRHSDAMQAAVPWHRVLAHAGAVGRPLLDCKGRTQAQCLATEGVSVDFRGRVADFSSRMYELTTASTGVTPCRR